MHSWDQQTSANKVQILRSTLSRLRRSPSSRGAFPTFEDGAFPSHLPSYFEDDKDYYTPKETRLLKTLRRLRDIRRQRRTKTTVMMEEELSFYQPLDEDLLPWLQELEAKRTEEERERPLGFI